MTKHKSVLAVLLSVMIVFTFMPTMAFADDAVSTPDELTKCTYTVSDSSAQNADSIAEAMSKVVNGGVITVEGTINNSIDLIKYAKNVTFDLSGAAFGNEAELVTDDDNCVTEKNGVYSFFPEHNYVTYTASPSSTTKGHADVVLVCEQGHVYRDPSYYKLHGTEDTEASSVDTVVYVVNNDSTSRNTINGLRRNYGVDVSGATWSIARSEEPVAYALEDVDYVKDGDGEGVAVMGADGKVQFFATYTADGELVLGTDGKAVQLKGTIVGDPRDGRPASATRPGTHIYDVEFEFPNGTKVTEKNVTATDTPVLTAQKDTIKTIQIKYEASETATDWANLDVIGVTVDEDQLIRAEDGSLTFRYVWTTKIGTEPSTDAYDDPETLTVNTTETEKTKKACGALTYSYNGISKEYKDLSGSKHTFALTTADLPKIEVEGKHPYDGRDSWTAEFVEKKQKHDEEVPTTAKCKYCSKEWDEDVATADIEPYMIPKSSSHTYAKDSAGNEIVYTQKATCLNKGYTYKWCTTSDGWNYRDPYYLDEEKTVEYVSGIPSGQTAGHPVLVEVTGDKTGHNFYKLAAAAKWTYGTNDTVCTAKMTCLDCEVTYTYNFHKMTVADAKKAGIVFDDGSEDTVTDPLDNTTFDVYEAIDTSVVPGKDCTEKNEVTYSVTKVVPVAVTDKQEEGCGPHSFAEPAEVVFSEDGKTAKVYLQCTKPNTGSTDRCLNVEDVNGNARKTYKDAVVNATENADGSVTYTATLLGYKLADNTKTLFDLSNAEVVVNGGEVLDLNDYAKAGSNLADIVEVKIRGAVIDKALYTPSISGPRPGKFVDGVNTVAIAPADASVIGSAEGLVKCIQLGQLRADEVKFDDVVATTAEKTVTYDGNAHTTVVSKVVDGNNLKVNDATVKYAVVPYADTTAEGFDMKKLDYSADKAEVTEAGEYAVFAKISKAEYTTTYSQILKVTVSKKDLGLTVKANKQVVTYGSSDLTVTTGDADADALIKLSAEDVSKFNVGTYPLADIVKYDDSNYIVKVTGNLTIEKRNATIVMLDDSKTYDGKEADVTSLFMIDGAVNGDTLNVIVNVKGGVTPKNAGKYTLVATANDANYSIETVTATYTINKIAQKVNSISPAKRSYTANSKGKLARKKTFMLKADVTGSKAAKLTFSKVSGNAKITVTSAGKVTVKKGLKAGTYTLKVRATKAGTKNYAKATKTKSIKIVIKKKSK